MAHLVEPEGTENITLLVASGAWSRVSSRSITTCPICAKGSSVTGGYSAG
jgi:hypothetical protein